MSNIREQLSEEHDDELLFIEPAEDFDSCIIGVASRCGMGPVVVYNSDKVIDAIKAQGLEEDEAIEFFEFNIVGAYVGERTPLFMEALK